MAAANKGECLPGLVGFAESSRGPWWEGALLHVGPAFAVCVCVCVRERQTDRQTEIQGERESTRITSVITSVFVLGTPKP